MLEVIGRAFHAAGPSMAGVRRGLGVVVAKLAKGDVPVVLGDSLGNASSLGPQENPMKAELGSSREEEDRWGVTVDRKKDMAGESYPRPEAGTGEAADPRDDFNAGVVDPREDWNSAENAKP